jgi:hypothetical protein
MTAWRDYQERAADIFRAHGMDATVEECVIGVRGQHDVDVVVRTSRAGIEQLWVSASGGVAPSARCMSLRSQASCRTLALIVASF